MSHSRSKVDRAGQVVADHLRLAREGKPAPAGQPLDLLEAVQIVDWWRTEHARPLSRVAANLSHYAGQHRMPTVSQRLKKFPTIADKLLREPRMKLSRMADIAGVRSTLPDLDAVYEVAHRLRRNWTITKFRDYVANPKADGYRAVHLVNRHHGRLIEIQLRTPLQDVWANAVESDARLLAPGLKFGGGPEELRELYLGIGEVYANLDRGLPLDPALRARVEDLMVRADTFRDEASE
jgi:ppGpp synthetase/RelA/SpoT-type nucleotidyltranferase